MGSAHHSTQGPVVIEGSPIVLNGKFAYGNVSKDLEGEAVQVFIRAGECDWTVAGEGETDSDGRVSIELPPMAPGLYDYLLVVRGDHSMTRGVIAVLPPGAPVVIFDIDGTLTVSDGEVFQEALLGSTPEIFEGATDVVQHYASAGIQPLYITGRTYHFQRPTVEWLDGQNLARGPLHTTDSVREAFPGSNVEDYKQAFLEHINSLGLRIVAAYGNASSDVCAYANAGVPPAQTWIAGDNGGTACE
ncbi:MAG: phosphatidate phosphatase PAH1, partial [Polyangiales bacterium]